MVQYIEKLGNFSENDGTQQRIIKLNLIADKSSHCPHEQLEFEESEAQRFFGFLASSDHIWMSSKIL